MDFRASGMPRVMKCPGSKLVQAAYPKPGGVEANEGTVAHGIAHKTVSGAELQSFLGQSIDNVYVDQEMLTHLSLYTNECNGIAGFSEKSLKTEMDGNALTGTPDFWGFETDTLMVKDLKYGYGWVEVFENWQLLAYASMLYFKLPDVSREACKWIELTIIQPRANHPDGPVRKWRFAAEHIRNYRNMLSNAMGAASLPEPPIQTGSHCRYCAGLLQCFGAGNATSVAIEYSGKARHDNITPEGLSLELDVTERAKKLLDQRYTALVEEGLSMSKKGTIIPGWETRSVFTPLKWNADPIVIGDAMGLDLRQPAKPITPTQAIDRKLLPEATVKSLAARSQGGMKLKRVDNARVKRIINNG